MKIAITHPIKRMICDQHEFLSSMLVRFPSLLVEWICKQEEEVEQLAKTESDGDYEIYASIYNSEISRIEPCYEEELLFYQAMLIMVYSYYESTLLRLSKENGIDTPWPSKIAEKFGKILEDEYLQISDFLFYTICPLRNQLCHNNEGTLFIKSSEEEIANVENLVQKKVLFIEDGRITFIDKNFIKKILEDEYKLLIKLAEMCGYRTIFHT